MPSLLVILAKSAALVILPSGAAQTANGPVNSPPAVTQGADDAVLQAYFASNATAHAASGKFSIAVRDASDAPKPTQVVEPRVAPASCPEVKNHGAPTPQLSSTIWEILASLFGY